MAVMISRWGKRIPISGHTNGMLLEREAPDRFGLVILTKKKNSPSFMICICRFRLGAAQILCMMQNPKLLAEGY